MPPVDKKQILIDSAKKLLDLGIPEREILQSFKDVGVSEQEAKNLVAIAKGEKPLLQLEKSVSSKKPAESSEEIYNEVYDFLDVEKDEEKPKQKFQEKQREEFLDVEEKSFVKPAEEPPSVKLLEAMRDSAKKASSEELKAASDFTALWEKGILTAVDSKLDEMRRLKAEIDSVIKRETSNAVAAESKKIEVLLQGQRTLLTGKVESALDTKKREIDTVIETRLSEIRRLNELTQENLNRLEAQRKQNVELLNSIQSKVNELSLTKDQVIREINALVNQTESKTQDLLMRTDKKLAELDTRVTRTLELESKIAEGLVKSAETRIDEIMKDRFLDLSKKIDREIAELESMKKLSKIDILNDKLVELDIMKDEMKKLQQQMTLTISSNIEEFKKLKSDLSKRLEEVEEISKPSRKK